ncbi:MAG: DUF2062 domain-containing protein [Candidatus Rokubacteria bacterium]|nr:DUF2062 domain-containing protein [Candidatus Rokubacteria bacterium]
MVVSWKRFKDHFRNILHLDEEPWRIAAGMGLGVFISFTPFYGFHTLVALLCAFAFRLNKVATVTGAWVNLPWFAPAVYGVSLMVGELILSGGAVPPGWTDWTLRDLVATSQSYFQAQSVKEGVYTLVQLTFAISKPLVVGTTVLGALAGAIAYLLTLEGVREVRRLKALKMRKGGRGEESR